MEIFIYILIGYIISEILCVLAVFHAYKIRTFYSEGLALIMLIVCLIPIVNTGIALVYWSRAFWEFLWASPSRD